MKNLSKDRLFFVMKMVSLCFICLQFCVVKICASSFNLPPTSNMDNQIVSEIIIPHSTGPNDGALNVAPIDGGFYYKGINKKGQTPENEDNRYTGIDAPLRRYFQNELKTNKSLANFHEENYIDANGQLSVSYYNGILTNIIKDFDGDGMPEMAIFKIRTDSYDEFSGKEIIVDMIKIFNDEAIKVEDMVLGSSQFNAEEIDLSIGIKYIDSGWRIYLNTYEKKVRDNQYNNYFTAVEYQNSFYTISKAEFYGSDDVDDSDFERINDIIDAGIDIRDDSGFEKRCFLNDDIQVIPVFSIKRINEKLREGYAEEFFEQLSIDSDDMNIKKGRYGYTQFLDRVQGM